MSKSNPLDDYLGSRPAVDEKRAAGQMSFPFMARQALGRAAGAVGQGALQSVGAAAGVGLIGAAAQAYGAISKRKDFRTMLDYNEDIKQLHQEDPEQINRFYDSARRMAPGLASDPYVAAHIVRQMADSGGGSDAGARLVGLINGKPPQSGLEFGADLGGQGPRFSVKKK
jgi:hypothetical protein